MLRDNTRLIFPSFPVAMIKMRSDKRTCCDDHVEHNEHRLSLVELKSKDAILSINETILTLNY